MSDLSKGEHPSQIEHPPQVEHPTQVEHPEVIPLDALCFSQSRPGVSATLKQQFTDFCVDEELGFEFSGSGEHLCLRLKKTDLSTTDVMRSIASCTGAPMRAIGYSGMKDRRAVTSQWFSLPLESAQEKSLASLESGQLEILETTRNSRKIKIGCHRANKFTIRLRDCKGSADEFESRLDQIRKNGVPNYFGPQRFGNGMSNVTQAMSLFDNALYSPDSKQTSRPDKSRQGRFKRGMLFSAARAYLFNQLISHRLENGSWSKYLPGDVLNLDSTSRFFSLEEGAEWDDILQQRLDSFDIHISGPLAGKIDTKDKYASKQQAADIEYAVLAQFPLLLAGLQHFDLMAARRTLRLIPKDLDWHWLETGTLELSFALSSGSFATSLIRELCVTD